MSIDMYSVRKWITFLNAMILIFTLKLMFYHWPDVLLLIFPEMTGLLCSFLRKSFPYTQV